MSYKMALEAAGAEVLEFQRFGSYQGDWWAKVKYENETFWVWGSFGSCSYCDGFEREFGYNNHGECDEHPYDFQESCDACKLKAEDYQNRLKDFGKTYLECGYSQAEAEENASRNFDWDSDAEYMVKFIKEHAIE